MIASLEGRVTEVGLDAAVISVGGIGYRVMMPTSMLASLSSGDEIALSTHLVVREDSMTIYGFPTRAAEGLFSMLLGVGGIGPKVALSLISALGEEGIRRAVSSSDIDALTDVPGVGKRTAERLALELKDKMGEVAAATTDRSKLAEVKDALIGLGYTSAELREVLESIGADDGPVEDLVRKALKELAHA